MDIDSIEDAVRALRGRVNVSIGWGTNLTNDFNGCASGGGDGELRAISIVCKVAEAEGRPTVKLSDNPNKELGPPEEIARYRRVFGAAGMAARRCWSRRAEFATRLATQWHSVDHSGPSRPRRDSRARRESEAPTMSQIAFPPPDPTILARRDEIVAGLAAILPPDGLIADLAGRRAFETDALTAYRRIPLAVALPRSIEEVAR